MLSRFALRAQLRPIFRTDLQKSLNITAVRCTSQVENWKKANELFYGPERDHKNFPTPRLPETPPPTRLQFIPASWFEFFYEKTGVTGPYVLGVGATLTLFSKELLVVEHNLMEAVGFWAVVLIGFYKFGPKLRAHMVNSAETLAHKRWYGPLEKQRSDCTKAIEAYENAIWREEGQKYIFEVKKENVALQLEEEYRRRLFTSYQAVKNRLDYHLAVETTKRRFEQQFMVNWIVDSVVKGITPQQERDSISKCISDLKMLSAAN